MMIRIQEFLKRFGETLLALIKVMILSRYGSGVKYEKREKPALMLLNGPSLTGLINKHGDYLKDKDLFCVNFFPLSELYEKLRPDYFIISAPELWLDDVEKVYKDKSRRTFKSLKEKTRWPLKVLIPFAARKNKEWKAEIRQNENIEVLYYNDTGIEGFRSIAFWFFKRRLAMPRPHNVLVPSLINAVNLGYSRIYLWGAENNQFLDLTVDENNNALIHQKHFYDKGKTKPQNMRKLGKGSRKIHEILYKFMLSFAAYHEIEKYARNRGAAIINQTPDSLIDAFKRERPGKK